MAETCCNCLRPFRESGEQHDDGVHCPASPREHRMVRDDLACLSIAIEVRDAHLADQVARVAILEAIIHTPHTDDWIEAVKLEAAHQIERWGTKHDEGKAPTDWFWLLGYLSGKALASVIKGDVEKAKHHTISSGAVLLNWFRNIGGESTAMRPGIADSETNRAV